MDQTIWLWSLGGVLGVLGTLIGVIWSQLKAEQKAQDDLINKKADKDKVDDHEKRLDKELDRIRFDHDKVIDRVENRFERELAAMEMRLGEKIDLILEILKKESK